MYKLKEGSNLAKELEIKDDPKYKELHKEFMNDLKGCVANGNMEVGRFYVVPRKTRTDARVLLVELTGTKEYVEVVLSPELEDKLKRLDMYKR